MKRLLAILIGNTEPADGRLLAWFAVLGFVGGGIKALIHRSPSTTWRDVLAAGVASALAGFGVGSGLLYAWGPDKVLVIFPIVSLAGWVGVALLDVAAEYAMGRVRVRLGSADAPPPPPPPASNPTEKPATPKE